MQDALNKIPTIDLATAWKNEKERRAVTTQARNSTSQNRNTMTLIATRPAPRPPQNVVKDEKEETSNFPSISGKDGYPIDRLRSPPTAPQSDEGLSVGGNASTSSGVQLSPNEDAVRRRSPRQTTSSARTPGFVPVTPGQPVRIPIPRPRPPPAEEEKAPEPVKTPLQRRPTTGLPSNPRAQTMIRRTSEENKEEKEKSKERQETVMFINSIVYDDPTYVNDIIQGATKTPINPPNSGDSSVSILDRPRPIRRMSDTDRQVFPSEPMHRRSKSGGSVASRKSILQSVPGSPTQLPPLPPPPKSAGSIQRPQPNDTKSMTFDEKMTLLYPPSTTTSPAEAPSDMKRKSSVPSLPPLPLAFRNLRTSPIKLEVDAGRDVDDERRNTKTTTDRSSIRTQSILGEDDDEASRRYTQNSAKDGTKRSSSPVLPAVKFSRISGASEAKTQFSTNWGSVHSPVAPIDVKQARVCPRETYIKNQGRAPVPSAMSETGQEVMTVMLDTAPKEDNRQSFFFEEEEEEEEEEKPQPEVSKTEEPRPSAWHRRVGDECLSFSERKDKVRSRMMPPPPPLLLNGIGNKKAIMIPAPEPSPLESPEAAIQVIQAQLKKFEQPNRDSVESTGRRIALLENLEQEMGMQENRWHSMIHSIDRDSVSTIQDTPVKESRPESTSEGTVSRSSSTRSIIADRRASRRARMASVSSSNSREQSTERPSSQNSDSRKSTVWQVRLAEAQSQYMEHANELTQKRNNLNFLSVSQSADLGSPTPPDSEESDSEAENLPRNLTKPTGQPAVVVNYLWAPSPQLPENPSSQLWMSPLPKETKPFPELPGLTVRPALRKSSEPLGIESRRLWQKPVESRSAQTAGLWTKAVPKERPIPRKIMVRQTTQRPPRKTKRITALPDIIESPKPLPEKRGTLGIFQFPWGQKSDNATIPMVPQVQPRMFMAMPGTMTSGGPRSMPGTMSSGGVRPSAAQEARSLEIQETEETGYSSSFFDDYEEEDSGDNLDDDYYDSGDDFDETTLWEIASLLKTDEGLPGRDSMTLPTMGGTSLDEYESEMSPDFERMYGDEYSGLDAVPDDSMPAALAMQSTSRAQDLWVPQAAAPAEHQFGLPQPDQDTWEAYIPDGSDAVRSQPRFSAEPAPIESESLWGAAAVPAVKAVSVQPSNVKAATWTPAIKTAAPSFGLPQPTQSVWASYVPDDSDIVRSQPRYVELAPIESESLWGAAAVSVVKAAPVQPLKEKATTWTPTVEKSVPSYGLPQPAQAVWASYIPSDSDIVRPQPRFAEIAPIESHNLWASATMQPMKAKATTWTPATEKSVPSYGLPQPTQDTWVNYLPAESEPKRNSPRFEDAAPLESTELWSPAQDMDFKMDDYLWAPVFKVRNVTRSVSPVAPVTPAAPVAPLAVAPAAPMVPEVSVKAVNALWTSSSSSASPAYGLPQPIASVWASYIPSDVGMTRTQSRREEIQPIQSNKLWSLQTESVPEMKMWSKPSVQEQQTFGLPQPDTAVWESYIPNQTESTRSQPRFEEMPATIESYNLWVPQEVEFASSTGLLWSESAETAALLSLVPVSATAATAVPKNEAQQATVSLWDQPAAVMSSESEGLFDVSAPRADYRRTSKLPAAISMTTKPRASHEPLPQLTSQQLWVAPRVTEEANVVALWAPSHGVASLPAPARLSVSAGLFELDSERTVYRTTDAEPAALYMTRKPRQITAPVPTIESSRMWSPSGTNVVEFDWITISTIRPRSPSLASVASSNSTVSSPTTDSSSVRTTATKASTAPSVAESTQSGFSLRGWFGRKKKSESDFPKVPEQPELPEVPEIPEIPEEFVVKNLDEEAPEEFVVKNLDEALRLDEPLPIKNLDEEIVIKNLDVVVPTKPAYIPTRQQYRQPAAYLANWDAALSEAIAASYPNTRFALVHASESQWDEALQAAIKASGPTPRVKRSNSSPKQWSQALAQAIAASYPDKRFSRGQIPYSQWEDELREAIARSKRSAAFDSSKRHPVFMASSLLTDSQDVHPAAIGYTFDAASRHPVFFGSATSTASETAHPAMPRLVKQQQKQQPRTSVSAPRPLSRGSKVAALAGRISFLNESSRPASVVVPPMPRMSVMFKAAAEPAPLNVAPLARPSKFLWSKPAKPAAQASQKMWTPSVRNLAQRWNSVKKTTAPALQVISMSERPQRKSSRPSSAAIEVSADFGAQGMWQRPAQSGSHSKNWLEGGNKHASKIQLRY
ncbi:hypothetical protein PG990_007751 [Apiospora arundinis]